ncbi:membrane protein, putative [Wolbachia endosymbiont of Drosophila ananassae]|nr:membrane protein, putative [Wolbachia endosymbiont of Drosophila ananassae]
MRLTNSLSHASERADIILLITYRERIGDVSE